MKTEELCGWQQCESPATLVRDTPWGDLFVCRAHAHTPLPDTTLELKKDTASLKQLVDLEELVDIPPERGGVYFSDWEKQFIRSVRQQFDDRLEFSPAQRDKIKEVWHAIDLRKRAGPDEKAANLFSKLSPARQAEQRARADKVKFPWER